MVLLVPAERGALAADTARIINVVNRSTPEHEPTPSTREPDARLEWRKPALRRIDALDARQMTKARSRHDALHLS